MDAKYPIMSKSIKWHTTLIIIRISIDALLHLCSTAKLLIREKTEKWFTSTSHYECDVWLLQNAVFKCTLLGHQYMGKDKGDKRGFGINIASNLGLDPFAGSPVYVATKHAVIGLTRSYGVSTACSNVDILY